MQILINGQWTTIWPEEQLLLMAHDTEESEEPDDEDLETFEIPEEEDIEEEEEVPVEDEF